MMFEKQKSGIDKLKGSSSNPENPSTPSSDAIQDSVAKSELEGSQVDSGKKGTDKVNANSPLEESSQEQSRKQKAPETEASENAEQNVSESSSQPSKRPRVEE